ncbi:MAG: hypothetical protein IKA48_00065 [Fibrobacter sp.]|nr:hypothetical protein [Fibrobacter sp.]
MADLLAIPSLAAKIGFSLVLGNGPSNDVVVAAGEMAKFAAVTNGKMITAVWEGHPIAGDSFCAKAELTQCDGVIEWGFSYSGQSSTCDVVSVSFPVVVRERTDETRILYPPALGPGRIFKPQWAKAKTDEKVQESRLGVPSFQFTALLTPGERSFYLDTRDTSNCARQFIYVNGGEPGTIELSHLVPVPLDEKSRKLGVSPIEGRCGFSTADGTRRLPYIDLGQESSVGISMLLAGRTLPWRISPSGSGIVDAQIRYFRWWSVFRRCPMFRLHLTGTGGMRYRMTCAIQTIGRRGTERRFSLRPAGGWLRRGYLLRFT